MRLEALTKINEALEKINHPGGDEHAAPTEEHVKEKPKADKTKKEEHAKEGDKKGEHKGPPVSDLLFDNLVVQK
jgi:ribosomal protein L12E/L44/L45/RPP1/RPP2